MVPFVEITTFFKNEDKRIWQDLAKVYQNSELLYSSVKALLDKHLSNDKIESKRILLKPNFVLQCSRIEHQYCLCTNLNLIIATLQVLCEYKPKSIVIGDAPIQDCDWDKLFDASFIENISLLSDKYCVPISLIDFRKVIYNSITNLFGESKRHDEDYLFFDVAERSFLEPITKKHVNYRVTNYDPRRMCQAHSRGKHKYCVAKELFDSDVVITMPKPKTHRMAGMTNSLKILVGINGDKDYLPHHRVGSQSQGGDCYKEYSFYRTVAEKVIDFANMHRGGGKIHKYAMKAHRFLWRKSHLTPEVTVNGGWYGNDTVWRMVMDLNLIAKYGKSDGTLSDTPQRTIYSLCDGIVGGQGEGPLNPDPLALGVLAFSNDSYLMDEVMGNLFHLDISRIPLLKIASQCNKDKNLEITINDKKVFMGLVREYGIDVKMSSGWVHY